MFHLIVLKKLKFLQNKCSYKTYIMRFHVFDIVKNFEATLIN